MKMNRIGWKASADVLHLVPGGYPLTIDVAQADIGGEGTAMRFALPLRAHNLPLMHQRETKLVVALDGDVEVRSGGRVIALLHAGEAVRVAAGVAHRVHQHGPRPSTVGVVLWPGTVELAFRQLAADVEHGAYRRDRMIALLAGYGVVWSARDAGTAQEHAAEVRPLADWFAGMPPRLAAALAAS